eukprot:COSAG01_NODE_146_length_24099_cov_25.341208_4_plen_60_part_00
MPGGAHNLSDTRHSPMSGDSRAQQRHLDGGVIQATPTPPPAGATIRTTVPLYVVRTVVL